MLVGCTLLLALPRQVYGQINPVDGSAQPPAPAPRRRGLPEKAIVPITEAPKVFKNEKVESILGRKRRGHIVHVELGTGLPGGELRNRFGPHGQVSAGYTHLFPSHFLLGLEAGFGYGRRVLGDPLSSLRDATGDIIAKDGSQAVDAVTERLWMLPTLKVGKMFVLRKRARARDWEHAVLLHVGGTYFSYKYGINSVSNDISQLDGDRKKGYDRLASGPAATLEGTYFLQAPRGSYGLFLKVQYLQGFTQSRRAYDFNLAKTTTGTMVASILSFQLGLAITLFSLDEQEYFYY